MLGTEAGSGEWTRLCTHRPHDCIDRSKVQARDEVNVEFRLLAHHAELAFPGAGQASHRALGAAAWGGAGCWGHTVLVREGRLNLFHLLQLLKAKYCKIFDLQKDLLPSHFESFTFSVLKSVFCLFLYFYPH